MFCAYQPAPTPRRRVFLYSQLEGARYFYEGLFSTLFQDVGVLSHASDRTVPFANHFHVRLPCLQPQWPWCLKKVHKGPPFFPSDEPLALTVAIVMGLQHALAMVGGIVTPPLIIGYLQDDPAISNCKHLQYTEMVTRRCSKHAKLLVAQLCHMSCMFAESLSLCRSRGCFLDSQRHLHMCSCKSLPGTLLPVPHRHPVHANSS